jgi:hypothetical protein
VNSSQFSLEFFDHAGKFSRKAERRAFAISFMFNIFGLIIL